MSGKTPVERKRTLISNRTRIPTYSIQEINNLINNLIIDSDKVSQVSVEKRDFTVSSGTFKKTYSFCSYPVLVELFDRICGSQGKSRSEVINKLIIQYCSEHKESAKTVRLDFFIKAAPGSQVNIADKQVILQKPQQPRPAPDYSQLTLEELQDLYDKSPPGSGDRQLIAWELKRRGVRK